DIELGMIHAVIAVTNSGIASWDYVNAKWLSSHESQMKAGVKWAIDVAKSRENPLPNDATPTELYQPIIYGLSLWECCQRDLVEREDDHGASKARSFIQWLKSEIPKQHLN